MNENENSTRDPMNDQEMQPGQTTENEGMRANSTPPAVQQENKRVSPEQPAYAPKAAEQPVYGQMPPAQPVYYQAPPVIVQTPPPEKKKHTGCIIAAVAAVAIVFLILCFMFVSCVAMAGIGKSLESSHMEAEAERQRSYAALFGDDSKSSAVGSSAPENSTAKSSEAESSIKESEEASTDPEPENSEEMVNGMRKSFVDAMDSYEAFFDEYADFMKAYTTSGNPGTMLIEYADFMSKYYDYMEKLDNWDSEEMNDKEREYYMQVHARIIQKIGKALEHVYDESSTEVSEGSGKE